MNGFVIVILYFLIALIHFAGVLLDENYRNSWVRHIVIGGIIGLLFLQMATGVVRV